MRRLFILLLFVLGGGWWAVRGQAPSAPERTRLLLIIDCSNSMWEQWQSNSKIKVTQQVLLPFLDSVGRQQDVEVALRVFGHLNKEQFGTRLEVPFGADNTYRLQSKIKTLVPQGGCTAAAALTDALSDFPATGSSRNLILIITDGMDDCDAEICDVARQVQLSGVVVQTFVLCIGGQLSAHASCAGSVFPVVHEEEYSKTLYDIFRLSGRKAKVVLNMVDSQGDLYETEHPVTFYDHRTGVSRQSTIYSVDGRLTPDTLLMDPLVSYDMTVFTHPPLRREAMQFSVDRVNNVDIIVSEGTLKVQYAGQRPQWQQPNVDVIVRRAGSGERVAAQEVGETGQYLAGRYDVEVQTLPVTTLRGVEVRGSAATVLSVPMPGMLVLSKPKGITTGAIFRLRDVAGEVTPYGRVLSRTVEFATDLNPSTAGERLLLQPGEYELVIHPQDATSYNKVQTRRFVIESGQTTKIQF
ncbi:MAG: VWA domain-containing protein [Bacteroidales bacterium]|nr:VWA domain-containing protein [Bacteroidales bacterium]